MLNVFFHQINALATLYGIVMPGLLPPCAEYYEVGTILEDGAIQKPLMAVSPDGVIRYFSCIFCH